MTDGLSALAALALTALAALHAGNWLPWSRRSAFAAFAFGLLLLGMAGVMAGRLILILPVWSLWCGMGSLALVGNWPGHWRFLLGHWRFLLGLALVGALTLGSALLLPASWDEQVYQTALLKHFCAVKSVAVWMDDPYSAYPLLPQMAMLAGFRMGGIFFPRLMVWLIGLILAGKLWLVLARRNGRGIAWLLTVAWWLSPLSLILCRCFYAECFVALFFGAGCLVALSCRKDSRMAALGSGFFAGAAFSVKLTGAGAMLALAVLQMRSPKTRRQSLWFGAGAVLAAFPFFLRVWRGTGNPFYPYGSALFGNDAGAAVERFHRMLGSARYGYDALGGLLTGWFSAAWDAYAYDGMILGWQGPVLLLLCGLAVWKLIRNGSWMRLKCWMPWGAALLAGYLFWAVTARQSRFLYPLWLVLFPVAEWLLRAALLRKKSALGGAMLLFAAALSSPWSVHLAHYVNAWRWLEPARKHPLRYLEVATSDPGYFRTMQVLHQLQKREKAQKVLFFMERRTLYAPGLADIWSYGFNERSLRVPVRSRRLAALIAPYRWVVLGSSHQDVDHQLILQKVQEQCIAGFQELLRAGAVQRIPLPEGCEDYAILRVVDGATGSTEARNPAN